MAMESGYAIAMATLSPPSTTPSDTVAAAAALGALGHEARLDIFRTLVRAGDDGLPVHAIQERLGGMPRSTLAHHLQSLVQAGLVRQWKIGTEVLNRADFAAMRGLVAFLSDECCADAAIGESPGCAPPAPPVDPAAPG
jgi:ArsR family transcriptional regulator, arsenate/arsenite/antimonite-responsive transcriptional repressor